MGCGAAAPGATVDSRMTMEVEFTCPCGQVVRAELGSQASSVQCPSCGRLLRLSPGSAAQAAPPMAAAPAVAYQPASGKAIAALVFGLCGLLPGVGLLAAPVGIGLGIAVLVRRLGGRGLSIAGIATGACGLLIIQTAFAFYVFMMVMLFRTMRGPMAALATMPATPTSGKATLSRADIRQALTEGLVTPGEEAGPPRDLAEARDLYARRGERAGNLFQCVKCFRVHLAQQGIETPPDAKDRRMLAAATQELTDEVRKKYDEARRLRDNLRWKEAAKAYGELMEIVPDEDNEIHQTAAAHRETCRRFAKAFQTDP
jgi:hypothetical protein